MKYFIFYCDVEWDSFNRREMILEMADALNDFNVIAVNRPAALIPNIFRRHKFRMVLKCLKSPIFKTEGRVAIIRPFAIFHDHIGAMIGRGRGNWLQRFFVDRALKHSGVPITKEDEVVIWLYEQTQWAFGSLTPAKKRTVVWEIFDDYRLTAQGKSRPLWIKCESNMISACDHIVTLTEGIKKKYLGLHKSITVIGNGYPSNLFYPSIESDLNLHKVNGPVVMYLGVIRDWIDFDTVRSLLERNPNKNFVFVGPVVANVADRVQALKKYKNFSYIPPARRDKVASFMSAADVAIIPYIESEFTRGVKPIKVFEFLACGVPVVTSVHADLKYEFGAIYPTSLQQFELNMEKAIRQADSGKCIELAGAWSWSSVVRKVISHLSLRGNDD